LLENICVDPRHCPPGVTFVSLLKEFDQNRNMNLVNIAYTG
jgi:hypothetical protein